MPLGKAMAVLAKHRQETNHNMSQHQIPNKQVIVIDIKLYKHLSIVVITSTIYIYHPIKTSCRDLQSLPIQTNSTQDNNHRTYIIKLNIQEFNITEKLIIVQV